MKTLPESLFRELADDLDVAIFVSDADGTVFDLNEKASSIVRLPRITATGRGLERMLPKDVAKYLGDEAREALATGKIRHKAKVSMILPGWGFRYFDIQVIPYRSGLDGPWLAYLLWDITNRERREIASETARVNAEAEARARRAFLARMSHEIRTPMNGIIGMTDLALQTKPEGEIGEYLGIIRSASESLLNIINDVLDFAKVESDRMELEQLPLFLPDLIHETISLLLPEANEKGIRLLGELDPELPENLIGDPTRIRQILINLMGNAVKFTEKGEVKVRLSCGARLPDLENDELMLAGEVSDTGIGISPDKLEILFDPFIQGDPGISRQYGGTGLGLAICRTLAHLMGGDIEVESAPGRGSIFRFRMRLRRYFEAETSGSDTLRPPAATPAAAVEPAATAQPRWDGLTVLLAEDNRVNRIVAEKVLANAGFTVISCSDGLEAIEKWRTGAPDLILMDIQMPNMDGLEAARRIRSAEEQHRSGNKSGNMSGSKSGKPVTIITLTAHVLDEERRTAMDAGMDGWVSKPMKSEALYSELERLLPPVVSETGTEG